jgi:hypothetical protein
MKHVEVVFFSFCLACGLVATLGWLGVLQLAGTIKLRLYPLFGAAAVAGWVAGNVFVLRTHRQGVSARLLLPVYLLGPLAVIQLLWSMAPAEWQRGAPIVFVLACAIYGVFFLVPWSLRASASPRLRRNEEDPRR